MTRAFALCLVIACSPASKPPAAPPASPPPTEHRDDRRDEPAAAPAEPAPRQTALRTRAHPFAIYIARMHRKLHVRWADGVLAALTQKPTTDPLNDATLAVTLAIAVDEQGAVDVSIVTPSHTAEYDEAAIAAVRDAAPYDVPPDAIKSADGKVHLNWTLYRDDRECGTFGVEPFIR